MKQLTLRQQAHLLAALLSATAEKITLLMAFFKAPERKIQVRIG
jgi:hypothetical protein